MAVIRGCLRPRQRLGCHGPGRRRRAGLGRLQGADGLAVMRRKVSASDEAADGLERLAGGLRKAEASLSSLTAALEATAGSAGELRLLDVDAHLGVLDEAEHGRRRAQILENRARLVDEHSRAEGVVTELKSRCADAAEGIALEAEQEEARLVAEAHAGVEQARALVGEREDALEQAEGRLADAKTATWRSRAPFDETRQRELDSQAIAEKIEINEWVRAGRLSEVPADKREQVAAGMRAFEEEAARRREERDVALEKMGHLRVPEPGDLRPRRITRPALPWVQRVEPASRPTAVPGSVIVPPPAGLSRSDARSDRPAD